MAYTKEQQKIDQREYRKINHVKIDARIEEWRAKNPEKAPAYKRAWAERNRDDIREYQRLLSLAFPEKGLARVKAYQARHLDHIMPCAIFDLTKHEHQKRCFHFSNMQPLFASENMKKSHKVLSDQFQLL